MEELDLASVLAAILKEAPMAGVVYLLILRFSDKLEKLNESITELSIHVKVALNLMEKQK